MDIRKQIKTRLSEKSRAASHTNVNLGKWDQDTQPNLYELDNFLRKAGYRLTDVSVHDGSAELIITALKPKQAHLYPEINHHLDDGYFYILMKDYGELIASDVEELMKGYQTALGVVRHLETLNLSLLADEIE